MNRAAELKQINIVPNLSNQMAEMISLLPSKKIQEFLDAIIDFFHRISSWDITHLSASVFSDQLLLTLATFILYLYLLFFPFFIFQTL